MAYNTYCTKQDLLKYFDQRDILRLTNQHGETEEVQDDVLENAIMTASATVDQYCSRVDPNDPALVWLASRITYYILAMRHNAVHEALQLDYDRAISQLKELNKNTDESKRIYGYEPKAQSFGKKQRIDYARSY